MVYSYWTASSDLDLNWNRGKVPGVSRIDRKGAPPDAACISMQELLQTTSTLIPHLQHLKASHPEW